MVRGSDRESTAGVVRIACSLATAQLEERREQFRRLTRAASDIRELDDGIALRFARPETWSARLVDFIGEERRCCPFLTFELVFEDRLGPVWLRLRGPKGVKAFLEAQVPEIGGEA